MKITLKNSKDIGIYELYDTVAKELGYDVNNPDIHYDCRKINVARNIEENIYEHYKETSENKDSPDIEAAITMALLLYGPKSNQELSDDEVEVEDGFISYENKEEQ